MSVSGVPATLAASYSFAGGSAGASVHGMTGAGGFSPGPAAVLQLSGRAAIIPSISQILRQELQRGMIDLAA